MFEYRDNRYGANGGAIWAFAIGPFVLAGIVGALVWAMIRIDFEDSIGVLLMALLACAFFGYFFLAHLNVLAEGMSTLQVAVSKGDDCIRMRLYFNKEICVTTGEIKAIETCGRRFYGLLPSLLNPAGTNYRVWLKSSQKIFIPGHMHGAAEVIDMLKNLSARQRDEY